MAAGQRPHLAVSGLPQHLKPSAIDFGPDFTPNVLRPETADDIEGGIKGDLLATRLDFDIDAFYVDFKNLVVATTDANGNPILQNAGGQHLRGVEASGATAGAVPHAVAERQLS